MSRLPGFGCERMNEIVKQALLYDFYGELLTPHQQEIYKSLVFDDLSLSEAAERFGISRQGVYDMMKRCNAQLIAYESKLLLVEKFQAAKKQMEHIRQLILEAQAESGQHVLKEAEACVDRLLDTFL